MKLTYISPSVVRLLGYSPEEAMAKKMEEVFTPASFETAMKVLAEELALEERGEGDPDRSRTLELDLSHKDGHVVPAEISYSFLRQPNGQPTQILAIARDISKRKEAEGKIRRKNAKRHALWRARSNVYCPRPAFFQNQIISTNCASVAIL